MSNVASRVRLAIGRSRSQWMLLLAWALLYALSFPRPNLWVLAHFALVPLIVLAVRGETPRKVAINTFLAGWLIYVFMLKWLFPVTWPGTVAVSAYFSLYVVAFVLSLRLVYHRVGVPLVLAVPVLWVALEWVRGWLWTGFAWYYLGHSQPTVMIQIADVVGAYGVSFVVAMTSGAIGDLTLQPLVSRAATGAWRRWGVGVRFALPLWFICLAGTIGYGIYRELETTRILADAPMLRVAAVQTNQPQSNKDSPEPGEDERFFAEMIAMSEGALPQQPQLFIWPETMVPRPLNEESMALYDSLGLDYRKYLDELSTFVRTHDVPMIVGAHAMIDWRPVGEPPKQFYRPKYRFNSAYLVTPAGLGERYDKIHRVPFGEYIPWVESWPWAKQLLLSFTPYESDYTLSPGLEVVTLNVGEEEQAWSIAAPICFEDAPSYLPRQMVYEDGHKRVDLLVNLTNDGWFAGTAQPWQHEQIARFRCVENRVPMARAVNTGPSSFIDSGGRIVARLEVDGRSVDVAGVAVHDVRRDDRVTLFGRFGDWLAWSCVAAAAGLVVVGIGYSFMTRRTRG